MNPVSHRAIVEDYYRAMGTGDFEHVVTLHDPEVVCWMSGQSLVSGRFQGRDELYAHMGEHVLGPLLTGEPYVKGSRVVIVDGDMAVGLLHGGLPTKDGDRYDQFYLQIFRFEDGLIKEIVEMFDTVMVEIQLKKNRLSTSRPAPGQRFDLDQPPVHSSLDRAGMLKLAQTFTSGLGKPGELTHLFANGAECRVIGSTPWSGKTDNLEILDKIFGRGLADVRVVAADNNAAVVLGRSADSGYAQQYGLLLEANSDRVGCVSIFLDTAKAEEAEFANPLLPGASRSIVPPFDVRQAFNSGAGRSQS